ncbi:bactofilin family protein [Salidesulfovibrio onnuriiensis]|uniref:bactofilin family protein n=1 Tax=Salidesulfovibrio onnuriiensis TaxID=2583823 RepID=UPI0011CAD1A1|nr:polymer-forming cytoskeletal protein [Salidesulfovibrio onnuriiensis]
MALFNKKNIAEGNPGELNAFLGVGTEYRGKLDFVGTVRIDGSFEGEISTDGTLVLGREATIKGTVRVGELSSCGKILGDVAVQGKAVLQQTSTLEGSLVAEKLVVEQGAVLQGDISMTGGFVRTVAPSADNVVRADFAPAAEFADEFPEETEEEQQAEAAGGVS